jgi:Na+/melibiose symporter-like transporter
LLALAGTQSEQAKTGILLGWVLIPGILLGISFLSLFLYPLAGEAWEKIKQDLGHRHAEKERKLLESRVFAMNMNEVEWRTVRRPAPTRKVL